MKTAFANGKISLASLARGLGGTLRAGANASQTFVCGLCTDSAEVDPQTAFVALRGKRTDGHLFLPNAIAAGCRCVVCEHAPALSGAAVIEVPDSEKAIASLAAHRRREVGCRVVGVTGSVGKTTTKEMIFSVLSRKFHVFATEGNHNSTVGMPLSLIGMPNNAEWAVLEMGMNALGEIERLSRCAEPDIALITNIGAAHLGMLGSRENILRAKLEILSGLRENGLFLRNADEEYPIARDGKNFRTISVSRKGRKADFSANNIRVESERTRFDLCWAGGMERDLCIRVAGAHHVSAALFAFAVGIAAGVAPEAIRAGLFAFETNGLRQKRTEIAGVTLIEDCYNASPESMNAALDVLDALCASSGRRGIAVLGEMRELGRESEELHRRVGERFAAGNAELLFALGQGGSAIAEGALEAGVSESRVHRTEKTDDLTAAAALLCETVRRGDIVWIKASRAVAAERMGSALKQFLSGKEGRDHA